MITLPPQEDSTWAPLAGGAVPVVENPYGEIVYGTIAPQPLPNPAPNTTLVVHKNLNMPHMPSGTNVI